MTVTLSWDASTDPTSVVAGYRVYRNGSLIQSLAPNQRSISDTYHGSEPIDLLYEIEAVDSFSNLSARTALASITLTPEQNQGPDDTDDDDTNNSATPSNSSVDEDFTTTVTSNPNSKQAPGAPQTGIRLPKQQTLVGSAVIGIPLLTLTAYMVRKYQR
jgi:hypothetical protein